MVEIASRIALHDVLREMVLDARDEGIDVRVAGRRRRGVGDRGHASALVTSMMQIAQGAFSAKLDYR